MGPATVETVMSCGKVGKSLAGSLAPLALLHGLSSIAKEGALLLDSWCERITTKPVTKLSVNKKSYMISSLRS